MGDTKTTASAGRISSRTFSKSSFCTQGPFMPHFQQPRHWCTSSLEQSRRETSCPAPSAPRIKESARVLELPCFLALPHKTRIFIEDSPDTSEMACRKPTDCPRSQKAHRPAAEVYDIRGIVVPVAPILNCRQRCKWRGNGQYFCRSSHNVQNQPGAR